MENVRQTLIFWFDVIIPALEKYPCICFDAKLSPCITFQNQPKYFSLLKVRENHIQRGASLFEANYKTFIINQIIYILLKPQKSII